MLTNNNNENLKQSVVNNDEIYTKPPSEFENSDIEQVKDISAEAGIIATIIKNPDFTYYSDYLIPNHFKDRSNAYLYWAIRELAKRNVVKIDAFNITNMLNNNKSASKMTEVLTIPALNELIDTSDVIARESIEDYKILVDSVYNKSLRRELFYTLRRCERLCFTDQEDVEQDIGRIIDNVSLKYSSVKEIPQYKDVVDDYWSEIQKRQQKGMFGIPFKFKALNKYATIEPKELFLFAAKAKEGKSIMLLNEAVDLLKRDQRVLYIDSELNSITFTLRLLSHLTGIDFKKLKKGTYSKEEAKKIDEQRTWLKTRKFTHINIPIFDSKSIYTTIRKVNNTQGIDVLIIDYFKSKSDGDAFATYQEMGALVDMIKNKVCTDMDIAGLGAVQTNQYGKIADSEKIGRNASAVAVIKEKTPEEIVADGKHCGNKKLRISLNRNGEQMAEDEYIDLNFNGNVILYEEASQHTRIEPY